MSTPSTPEGSHRRHFGWLEDLVLDLRYSIRSLQQRGNRSFAVVAVLTLALGIGSATSIFSVGNGFLNDAYPYEDVGNIWSPWVVFPPNNTSGLTRLSRNFVTEMEKLPAVAEVMSSTRGLQGTQGLYIDGEFGPEFYQTFLMSGNGFNFLGVPAAKGRTIQPSDIAANGAPADVVVLSDAAAKKFFPGEKDPIGKVVDFKDNRGGAMKKTVIGVMPLRFGGQAAYDIGDTAWTPMPGPNLDPASANLQVRPRVRLKPGIEKVVAEQQFQSLFTELAKNPQAAGFWLRDVSGTMTARPFNVTLRDIVSSTFDPQGVFRDNVKYLSVAVALLLLIACMNVANLQLARAAARSREIAVRLAMGAARNRIMRQLITESVVLALAGAAVGILLAYGMTKGALSLMPPNTFGGAPLPAEARIGINPTAMTFAAIVAVISGILFGLAPAIQSTHPDLNDALKAGGRGSSGSSGARTRSALVIAEVAFSVILLVVASVTLWGYVKMARVDPGYNPNGLYVMFPGFPATDARAGLLLERSRALPFLTGVARANNIGMPSKYTVDDKPKDDNKQVLAGLVDADFLKTAGITLIRGRNFDPGEVARGDPVALLGDTASSLWPEGVDPLGKQITLDVLAPAAPPTPPGAAPATPPLPPTLTIIGIVSNLRPNVSQDPQPFVWVPYMIRPAGSSFAVRVREGTTPSLQMEIQKIAFSVDKNIRITMQDMGSQFDTQFQMPRFNFILFCSLATIALILAITGIYSVLSYHIIQRTREFGVRLALGADRSAIINLVLGAGGRLLGVGLVVGIAGSIALSRIVASQTVIFRVDLSDPTALGVSFLSLVVMSAAAIVACFIPARRATKVDPLTALRAD